MRPDEYRHRTARERRADASAARAVERARAHTARGFDLDEDRPDAGGYITPAVARQIPEHIERGRSPA